MEIKVVRQILEWNEDVSQAVSQELRAQGVCLVNVMGSPGAGKTSLIMGLISCLKERLRIGVIEGDVAGQLDAERIAALGIPVVQLNTGGACHIEAMSVQQILPHFDLNALDLLFVENIGNLVCPAEFNLGEDLRIAVLSVPEGDDKVEKYPLLFATTDVLVLQKYDTLPLFDFEADKLERQFQALNPQAPVFRLSARTGAGLPQFAAWLAEQLEQPQPGQTQIAQAHIIQGKR